MDADLYVVNFEMNYCNAFGTLGIFMVLALLVISVRIGGS